VYQLQHGELPAPRFFAALSVELAKEHSTNPFKYSPDTDRANEPNLMY
jgi:hypothetical protein